MAQRSGAGDLIFSISQSLFARRARKKARAAFALRAYFGRCRFEAPIIAESAEDVKNKI
jgi:hypothetical protein